MAKKRSGAVILRSVKSPKKPYGGKVNATKQK